MLTVHRITPPKNDGRRTRTRENSRTAKDTGNFAEALFRAASAQTERTKNEQKKD